jgi:DNA-binding transcriptional MerR regulator
MFTIKHLQERLKSEGLPHTHKSIAKYEKSGLIHRPAGVECGEGSIRVYSASDIEYIVLALKKRKV